MISIIYVAVTYVIRIYFATKDLKQHGLNKIPWYRVYVITAS